MKNPEKLLDLLAQDARLTPAQLAALLGESEEDVAAAIKAYEKNSTILGYKTARTILDSMGYDYIVFDEHHFNEDLQWADAVPIRSVWSSASSSPTPSRSTPRGTNCPAPRCTCPAGACSR